MIFLFLLLSGCSATIQFPPRTGDEPCAALPGSDTGTPKVRFEVRRTPQGPLCWTADL